MKTTKKQSQCQRLLAYLKKNPKGITTMEAFEHLRITCVHKRIAELEGNTPDFPDAIVKMLQKQGHQGFVNIARTREKTATGSIVTRYKLAR